MALLHVPISTERIGRVASNLANRVLGSGSVIVSNFIDIDTLGAKNETDRQTNRHTLSFSSKRLELSPVPVGNGERVIKKMETPVDLDSVMTTLRRSQSVSHGLSC